MYCPDSVGQVGAPYLILVAARPASLQLLTIIRRSRQQGKDGRWAPHQRFPRGVNWHPRL